MRSRIDNGKVGPVNGTWVYLIMAYILIGIIVAMSMQLSGEQALSGILLWPIVLGG